MFDPFKALARFLSGRADREQELMQAGARYLERARAADNRAAALMAALGRVRYLAEEGEAADIIVAVEDALAEVADDRAAVDVAGIWLVNACHGASLAAGWWMNPETGESRLGDQSIVPTKLMLIVSEVAEAMEGHRKNLPDDKLPDRPMIEVELADAVIRIADLAGALGLDLGGAIAAKMAFNTVRPDHKIEARLSTNGKVY